MVCQIGDQCLPPSQQGQVQEDQVLGPENQRLIPNLLLTPVYGTLQPQGQRARPLPPRSGKEGQLQHLCEERRMQISMSYSSIFIDL